MHACLKKKIYISRNNLINEFGTKNLGQLLLSMNLYYPAEITDRQNIYVFIRLQWNKNIYVRNVLLNYFFIFMTC